MDHNTLLHWEPLHVRGYDVNREHKASVPAVIQMLHEAAMQHVSKLKLSANELAELDLGWVLHQQFLEVSQMPRLGDRLKVLTHPSGTHKLFTFRDFHLFDENDKPLARATTSWFLMNTKRRRIARYPAFISQVIDQSNELDHLPRVPALELSVDTPEEQEEFTVHYHDLDFNGHLSNYYYSKWMLDALPFSWWKNHTLTSFNIQFKEECFINDRLTVEIQQKENLKFAHRMIRDGREMARAVSAWREDQGKLNA